MMYHAIGIFLIIVVAPLVGLAGNVIADNVHEGAGRTVSVGGVLAVLGVAAWFIVRSF
ncbi:hypothetical protein M2164_008221 [Streptomyces sp. SAI-208]|uniref:hypothetical protein n=2 Tax=Streptomyces TaxID=1883 RepID=UPI0024733C93|nr:hypothetical protein [Streptomyces sp. SAI-208]MDH6612586.1 hypothetical protein [Streptomyces sp. SAI-208]